MSLVTRLKRRLAVLRWHSIAIVLGGALIALLCDGFVAYVLWTTREETIRTAEEKTADSALVLEQYILRTMQGVDLLMATARSAVEANPALRTQGNAELTAFLARQLQLFPSVGNLSVIDAAGTMTADARGAAKSGQIFNFADRPYLQAQRDDPGQGLFVDVPRESRVTHETIIGISRAMRAPDGRFDGIVLALIYVSSLQDFFGAIDVGRMGRVRLWRDDGMLLMQIPDDGLSGQAFPNLPMFSTMIPNAPMGSFQGSNRTDGTARLISYRTVPGLPLVVTVGRANVEFLAEWVRTAWIYGTIAALLNVLVLGLGALLAREVSRRETSESAIRARERLIRMIADNVPMLIAYVDKNQVYRFVNRVAARWMNRPVTEFTGRTVAQVLPPPFYERSKARIAAVLAGRYQTFEEQRVYGDGVERWADVTYVPVVEADRAVSGYIVLVSDITERKAAEERLRERDEQLRQAQKMEVVGRLTGGVAHDFNNLLGIVIGNLDLLALDLHDQPGERQLIERAIAAAERGGALTRQLLAFSRKQMLQPQSIDVAALLADLGVLLHRILGANIAVTIAADDGVWPCRADRPQLETALLNLALNARDAMPQGGRIAITASSVVFDETYAGRHAEVTPGAYVAIAVADSGSGMTAETVERAFEPFFTTKEVGKGSGLGLSMVYGFVKQSGGHVRLDSEPGSGTTVTLYLPRSEGDATSGGDGEAAPEPIADGRGRRVLVVEDNAPLRDLAVTVLGTLGYDTLEAETADQALALLAANNDIVLLFTDIMLPGGRSGIELAADARRRWPHLKILYASGHPNIGPASLGEDAVIVPKPFHIADLARHVKATLES